MIRLDRSDNAGIMSSRGARRIDPSPRGGWAGVSTELEGYGGPGKSRCHRLGSLQIYLLFYCLLARHAWNEEMRSAGVSGCWSELTASTRPVCRSAAAPAQLCNQN